MRSFAGVSKAALDPFVHMDQMGEVDYQPGEPRGTGWHPHRGFETVTYMIDGRIAHQDSRGGGGVIADGATQWMTAGSGVLHIETPPAELVESGGLFHGIQLWVNLPRKAKFVSPRYQAIAGPRRRAACLAVMAARWSVSSPVTSTIAAGRASPTRRSLWRTPPSNPALSSTSRGTGTSTRLVYVLSGRGSVGPAKHPIQQGQLAVLGSGDRITITAEAHQDSHRPALEALLLGGQPIREPVFHYGPFVMNSKAELIEAIEDYEAGKFGAIPRRRVDAPPARPVSGRTITAQRHTRRPLL